MSVITREDPRSVDAKLGMTRTYICIQMPKTFKNFVTTYVICLRYFIIMSLRTSNPK